MRTTSAIDSFREPRRQMELVIFIIMVFLLFVGLVMTWTAPDNYRSFVSEDGPAEWIATVSLLGSAIICIERIALLRNSRKRSFLLFSAMAAVAFMFASGEELSWGQRILGIESQKLFLEYNCQQENNIHNLFYGDFSVNKVVFGTLMSTAIAGYLLVLPFLYRKSKRFGTLVNRLGIPVPRFYQAAMVVATAIIVSLIDAPDKWELMELNGSMQFLSIFLNPANQPAFCGDRHPAGSQMMASPACEEHPRLQVDDQDHSSVGLCKLTTQLVEKPVVPDWNTLSRISWRSR